MSIIDKIVVDEMFHIEGVDFALPEDGYRPINEYLNTRYRIVLPPTFDWRWNVENQGSLPKRISAYLHKNHNVDLTQTEKEKIGTIARNKTFTRSSYNFQFGRIDWARGAYGDEESCFFSDRWFARAMLMSNGAMAVKFFNDDGSRFGRAWIALSKYCPDLIFTFNAYPKSFALDQVALVVSRHLGLAYRLVMLTNGGKWDGKVWINNGRAFVLYERDGGPIYEEYDLHYEHASRCGECGATPTEEHTHIVKDKIVLCDGCLMLKCIRCAHCSEYVLLAEARQLGGEKYCEPCYSRVAVKCEACGSAFHAERLVQVERKLVCRECFKKTHGRCHNCGKAYRKEEFHSVPFGDGATTLCNKCFKTKCCQCAACGKMTHTIVDYAYHAGGFLCAKCAHKAHRCRRCLLLTMEASCDCLTKAGEEEISDCESFARDEISSNSWTYILSDDPPF